MLMLKAAYDKALKLLREHRSSLDQIAEFLIRQETITGEEFMKIFRRCEGLTENGRPSRVSTIDGIGISDSGKAIELPDNSAVDAAEDGAGLKPDARGDAEPDTLDIRSDITPLTPKDEE